MGATCQSACPFVELGPALDVSMLLLLRVLDFKSLSAGVCGGWTVRNQLNRSNRSNWAASDPTRLITRLHVMRGASLASRPVPGSSTDGVLALPPAPRRAPLSDREHPHRRWRRNDGTDGSDHRRRRDDDESNHDRRTNTHTQKPPYSPSISSNDGLLNCIPRSIPRRRFGRRPTIPRFALGRCRPIGRCPRSTWLRRGRQ